MQDRFIADPFNKKRETTRYIHTRVVHSHSPVSSTLPMHRPAARNRRPLPEESTPPLSPSVCSLRIPRARPEAKAVVASCCTKPSSTNYDGPSLEQDNEAHVGKVNNTRICICVYWVRLVGSLGRYIPRAAAHALHYRTGLRSSLHKAVKTSGHFLRHFLCTIPAVRSNLCYDWDCCGCLLLAPYRANFFVSF